MRAQFTARTIRLVGQLQRDTAVAMLNNAPLDAERPLELILREEVKARKPDHNSAMWAGPLADIAEQAWVDKRQYSAEVWHEFLKREYLPDETDPNNEGHFKDGYLKYDFDPAGKRVLIGSTTQLTTRGMAIYIQKIEAHGGSLGVMFHESPRRVQNAYVKGMA